MSRPPTRNGADTTSRHVETRLTRLESAVEGIQGDLTHINTTLDTISSSIQSAQRPNWSLLIQAAGFFLVLGGFAVTPLWQRVSANETAMDKVQSWQYDYMLGRIPSSAEPKLAAMQTTFTEVETQFHSFRDKIADDERYTKERADTNSERIDKQAEAVKDLAVAVAQINERTAGLRGAGVVK